MREDESTKNGNDNRWKTTNKRNYNGEVGTSDTKDHLDQEIFIQSSYDKATKTTEMTKEGEIKRPNISEKGLEVVGHTTTQDMEKDVGIKAKAANGIITSNKFGSLEAAEHEDNLVIDKEEK
ncbi:hypothetical protein FRX31_005733 [Thalictrum thalictroides]|uniref:Uncharacterized protein n=1 Tax=Thalictrum thalictroides TaxID=46969 RepID=A0A7J6X4M6_THATH|nr:hypothetical protein FRX31_005733 [Thalictrum thalictroides]